MATIRETFPGAEVGLTPSGGGVFEVSLDGKLIFSKKALGRHALPGEILALMRAAGAA
jgi:selT/selW/selH-like putative selenoprotein